MKHRNQMAVKRELMKLGEQQITQLISSRSLSICLLTTRGTFWKKSDDCRKRGRCNYKHQLISCQSTLRRRLQGETTRRSAPSGESMRKLDKGLWFRPPPLRRNYRKRESLRERESANGRDTWKDPHSTSFDRVPVATDPRSCFIRLIRPPPSGGAWPPLISWFSNSKRRQTLPPKTSSISKNSLTWSKKSKASKNFKASANKFI